MSIELRLDPCQGDNLEGCSNVPVERSRFKLGVMAMSKRGKGTYKRYLKDTVVRDRAKLLDLRYTLDTRLQEDYLDSGGPSHGRKPLGRSPSLCTEHGKDGRIICPT